MAVELEAQRLLLFVREGKRDETLFGVRARELARVCGPVPEIKTEVLVLVRAAKDCLFSNAVGASVVEVKSDDVRRACRQIRVQCGEQLLEEREPEAKVKTWGATHAVKVSEVPATWDEMQRSGVLYGDGHAHVPVVVTETTVSPRKGAGVTQARRSDNPAAAAVARGHQSSAVKPDPARDKALLEIEAMFGEDAQFDEIAAKAPVSPRREVAAVKSPKSNDEAKKKSVAIAARPVVPSAQINAALPQSLGGLRVVK